MQKFSEWLKQKHPEFEIQEEWPQWMKNAGNKVKKAGAATALAASLLGPGASYVRNPSPVDFDVSADYYSAMDDTAKANFEKDLATVRAGKHPEDWGGGEEIKIAASGKKSGTSVHFPSGFGGSSDPVRSRGWHTPFANDRDSLEKAAIHNALSQVRNRAGLPSWAKNARHHDIQGLKFK